MKKKKLKLKKSSKKRKKTKPKKKRSLQKRQKKKEKDIPIISSMGAGNKLEASGFKVADIYKTKMCPLAKVMRYELKKRGVKKLKVVYSEEKPLRPKLGMSIEDNAGNKAIPGSVAFVPSVAGLIIAGEIVKDLAGVRGCF